MNNDLILDLLFVLFALYLIFIRIILPLLVVLLGVKFYKENKIISILLCLAGIFWLAANFLF